MTMPTDTPSLAAEIRRPFLAGLLGILVFFAGFAAWAALAPIVHGVVAAGQLVPTGYRRAIQHLEGGIIADIRVRDGMRVRAGDLLLTLQPTNAAADLRALVETGIRLAAEATRLRAERGDAAALTFPPELASAAHAAGLDRVLADESWRFSQRRQSLARERDMLTARLRRSEAAARSFEAQIEALRREQAAARERHERTERLVKGGSSPQFSLLEGEERLAGVAARIAEAMTELESERRTVDETRVSLAGLADGLMSEIGERLSQVEAELAAARERRRKIEDMLARTEIRAPVDGIVLNSVAHTIGGVVPPGATMMELVPSDEPLVAELRVAPTDVDRLLVGAKVRVRLLAFPQRHMPPVEGAVLSISADAIQPQPDARSYYLVRARLDPDSIAAGARTVGAPVELTPGMPVQGVIEYGSDTLMAYLLEPLARSLERSFKDG